MINIQSGINSFPPTFKFSLSLIPTLPRENSQANNSGCELKSVYGVLYEPGYCFFLWPSTGICFLVSIEYQCTLGRSNFAHAHTLINMMSDLIAHTCCQFYAFQHKHIDTLAAIIASSQCLNSLYMYYSEVSNKIYLNSSRYLILATYLPFKRYLNYIIPASYKALLVFP